MNNLFRALNIPYRPNYDLVESKRLNPINGATRHFPIPEDQRDPGLVQFLHEHGMFVKFSELFYTAPSAQRNIHIDGNALGLDIFKMNWVYGADGSTMKWFNLKEGYEPTLRPTVVGTYAYVFPEDQCNLLYETEIKHPCVIHAGIPHTVLNNTNEGRWCVSYTISDMDTGRIVTWDKVVAKLGQYFIDQ